MMQPIEQLIGSTVKFLDYRVACIRHREEEEGEAQKKITPVLALDTKPTKFLPRLAKP